MKQAIFVVLISAMALATEAGATPIPGQVPFTARLADGGGPINGNVSLTFSVFDVATGGTAAWTETHPTAAAQAGLVFVDLGSQTSLDSAIFNGGTKYLEVSVNGTTMTPRLAIGSAPYAIHAGTSDTLGALAETDVQRRVTGVCASGAISTVNSDGSVACVAVGQTYAGAGGVNIAATTVSLSTTGCAAGYVWKYNGAAFTCQPDANTIYTGAGGVSVAGTMLSLDTTGCAAGYVWKYNGAAFTCAPDANTAYTGGTGINVTGTVVSLVTPVSIANGGTGAATQTAAIDGLLPSQTGNANDVLTTNATDPSWATLRSVLATGDDNGLVVKGTYAGAASTPPATGAGARMMWYPQRAAFRAGSVSGTQWDDASVGNYSTAMGTNTTAIGQASTAFGSSTTASGPGATAMGVLTTASGQYSTAIGYANVASENYAVALGAFNTASGQNSVAIGSSTIASGNNSTAMGLLASTNSHPGSFVYGDSSTATTITAAADNEFAVRASGGFRLFTNSSLTAGVTLGAGAGSWTTVSDRNAKQDFHDVDGEVVLAKIAAMAIQSWRYKAEVSHALHIGPVAQDFRAAFGLGDSDRTISTVDIDGVNMLAVQALARRSSRAEQKAADLEHTSIELARENAELRGRLSSLEEEVHRLEDVGGQVAARRTTKR